MNTNLATHKRSISGIQETSTSRKKILKEYAFTSLQSAHGYKNKNTCTVGNTLLFNYFQKFHRKKRAYGPVPTPVVDPPFTTQAMTTTTPSAPKTTEGRQQPYGRNVVQSYRGTGDDSYGGNGGKTYGGIDADAYGGNGGQTYGGTGDDSYGGNGGQTYGGTGDDSYGGNGGQTDGGIDADSYGEKSGQTDDGNSEDGFGWQNRQKHGWNSKRSYGSSSLGQSSWNKGHGWSSGRTYGGSGGQTYGRSYEHKGYGSSLFKTNGLFSRMRSGFKYGSSGSSSQESYFQNHKSK